MVGRDTAVLATVRGLQIPHCEVDVRRSDINDHTNGESMAFGSVSVLPSGMERRYAHFGSGFCRIAHMV